MNSCPSCYATTDKKIQDSPYWACPVCDLWFQNPMPPKLYEAPEEKGADGRSGGHQQNPDHLAGAATLARAFWHNWISKINVPYKPRALDIGAKYPYFAYILNREFQVSSYGIDGMDKDTPDAEPIVDSYAIELGVPMMLMDFEDVDGEYIVEKAFGKFHAVSMIHVFEHMYDPKEALHRVRKLITDDGVFLIRLPAHDVTGWEMHMSERHYPIHPFYYSDKSLTRMIHATDVFEIAQTYAIPGAGARDFILRPK